MATAEEEYEARRRAHAVVERELTPARSEIRGAEEAIKQAVKRVIGASGEAERLVAEFETVARSYASLRSTILWLGTGGLAGHLASASRRLIQEAEVVFSGNNDVPPAPDWTAAVAMLHSTPDAPLSSHGPQ